MSQMQRRGLRVSKKCWSESDASACEFKESQNSEHCISVKEFFFQFLCVRTIIFGRSVNRQIAWELRSIGVLTQLQEESPTHETKPKKIAQRMSAFQGCQARPSPPHTQLDLVDLSQPKTCQTKQVLVYGWCFCFQELNQRPRQQRHVVDLVLRFIDTIETVLQ